MPSKLLASALVLGALACASTPRPIDPEAPPYGSGLAPVSAARPMVSPAAAPGRATSAPPSFLVADIPCSADARAFLPALEARVLHRVRTPVGLVPLPVASSSGVGDFRVKVVMEIDRRGTIRRAAVATTSGLSELDRAVVNAIDEAGCMPSPPRALIDVQSGTFRISLGYLFRRG